MTDYNKLISLVFEKRNLEQALHYYGSLESVTAFYPCEEFETLPAVRNKLHELYDQVCDDLDKFTTHFTQEDLQEVRKIFYTRFKMSPKFWPTLLGGFFLFGFYHDSDDSIL